MVVELALIGESHSLLFINTALEHGQPGHGQSDRKGRQESDGVGGSFQVGGSFKFGQSNLARAASLGGLFVPGTGPAELAVRRWSES